MFGLLRSLRRIVLLMDCPYLYHLSQKKKSGILVKKHSRSQSYKPFLTIQSNPHHLARSYLKPLTGISEAGSARSGASSKVGMVVSYTAMRMFHKVVQRDYVSVRTSC